MVNYIFYSRTWLDNLTDELCWMISIEYLLLEKKEVSSLNWTFWLKRLNTKIWRTLRIVLNWDLSSLTCQQHIHKHYSHETKILYATALDSFFQGEQCMLQERANCLIYRNKLLVTFHSLTTLQNILISLCNHWRLFFSIYRWPQFHLKSWKEKRETLIFFN